MSSESLDGCTNSWGNRFKISWAPCETAIMKGTIKLQVSPETLNRWINYIYNLTNLNSICSWHDESCASNVGEISGGIILLEVLEKHISSEQSGMISNDLRNDLRNARALRIKFCCGSKCTISSSSENKYERTNLWRKSGSFDLLSNCKHSLLGHAQARVHIRRANGQERSGITSAQ